ncbi:MAG: oligosaccharide flippase family protein, partial [Acidobacteriota bacterium]|nr:oligosaccharide flippase family protein [Acidobacteriota bacterium]
MQFSGYALPLISLPYLSRVLSTEKFGLIAFAQTFIWYFLAFTEYGFNLTATRSIAVMRDQPEELTRIFSAVMMAKFLLTVVGFGLFCVTVLAVPSLRPNWVLYLIAFVTVIANLLFPLWLFQGLQTMQHVAIRDVAAKLLSLVLLFVFVHGDGDYLIAAAAQSGGLLLAGIAGLVTALQKSG